jgi:hypothetical protein
MTEEGRVRLIDAPVRVPDGDEHGHRWEGAIDLHRIGFRGDGTCMGVRGLLVAERTAVRGQRAAWAAGGIMKRAGKHLVNDRGTNKQIVQPTHKRRVLD